MVEDDITHWVSQLAQGDSLAAQNIWDRYYEKLVYSARKKLGDRPLPAADEEDVALSAFHSFCRGAAAGRFPQLNDRHDLWKLLVTITARKAVAHLRREHAQKRGGGAVRGESAFITEDAAPGCGGIDQVLGREPTPEFAVQVAEQCELMIGMLDDQSLRVVALLKLESYTNEEIARTLDCALGTVERKLSRIRKRWESRID